MHNRDILFVILSLSLVGACSADDGDPLVGNTDRALVECAVSGDPLTAVWSVGNGHGAITAMTVGGSVVALAAEDGSVKTWSLVTADKTEVLSPAVGGVYGGEFEGEAPAFSALAFDGDQNLAAGDTLGSVGLFELSGNTISGVAAGEMGVVSVASRAGSSEVALATEEFGGQIGVWNPGTNEFVAPLETILWGVGDVTFTADGGRLLVAGDWYGVPAFELWDADQWETSRVAWVAPTTSGLGGEAGEIVAAAVTPDGKQVLVGGRSPLEPTAGGFVALLDLDYALAADPEGDWANDAAVIVDRTTDARAAITDLAMAPDGASYAVASADGSVQLFVAGDLSVGVSLPTNARFVAYTDDGARLITSGDDGELNLWACE
jgi:WD40 repeat protein